MNKAKNGFTLVEVLIALVVGLVIMAAVYGVMNMSQHSSAALDRRIITQQDTRAIVDLLATEIRMASFDRWHGSFVNLWTSVPLCPAMGLTAAAVKARKGIQIADANNLLVTMDLNSDGVIGAPGANEYIKYTYNTGASTITRNVSCGNNEVILGGAGSNTLVRNNAAATPLFQYYDESDTEISSANLVANPNTNIPLIRRIRINVVVDIEKKDKSFAVSRRTYSTDIVVKNHVLSP